MILTSARQASTASSTRHGALTVGWSRPFVKRSGPGAFSVVRHARAGSVAAAGAVLAIVLSAGAVAVAGPIAFISLTAPQIAKRLTRVSGPHPMLSALTGALLLVLGDLPAQQLPLPDNLPVGIYTMAIGGLHLGRLLVRELRRGVL
ncbi:iron chelate uptake ABC transporter family permease subunit [Streptomyces sp. NPDC001455]|uniref:iron chelate uptake ABC transporter family permease subunit n=1 Tax=Streptomyces sp. NPDC001455 TaxID=3154518 RepID=UPI0033174A53